MAQFTSLLTSAVIIITIIALVGWCYFIPQASRLESFCSGKWNPDMYLPITERLRFPFPERRLQAWYLPEAYWGDKPRFDYAFSEDSAGKLTPVWPNVPIKPRMASAEY